MLTVLNIRKEGRPKDNISGSELKNKKKSEGKGTFEMKQINDISKENIFLISREHRIGT